MTARRCKPFLLTMCILFFMSSTTLGFQPSASIINSHGRIQNRKSNFSSNNQSDRSQIPLNLWNSDGDIEGPDRIKSCIPYMVCSENMYVTHSIAYLETSTASTYLGEWSFEIYVYSKSKIFYAEFLKICKTHIFFNLFILCSFPF